jgi:hypothetical protein
MKLLQNLDLYKSVIWLSLPLTAGAGWWIKTTRDAIAAANRAITDAVKPNGQLEEIGKLQKQLEIVEANRAQRGGNDRPEVYFEGQIFRSVKQGTIGENQFKIQPLPDQVVQTSTKQSARDFIVKIEWLPRSGKDFTFPRELLFAVLFNCESGARDQNTTLVPSIWKLYSLKITNAGLQKELTNQLTPPVEVEDNWLVGKMEFARREPNKR